LIFIALLDTVQDLFELSELSKKISLRGVLQALKIVGFLSVIILVISQLAGKSPVYYLSGLGAFTAILLLVFKDSFGIVAGGSAFFHGSCQKRGLDRSDQAWCGGDGPIFVDYG
jgi:miniconductance mechanosensitive channel